MRIATLSYIHALLIEDEEKKRLAAKWQRERWLEAVDQDAPNQVELNEIYIHLRDDHSKAYDALQEFVAHEW